MNLDKIELIVVFKKDILKEDAQRLLEATGIPCRKGMDSSRGKIYFYSTGPKFILTFEDETQRKKFIGEYHGTENIHEVYEPDWDIQKDWDIS